MALKKAATSELSKVSEEIERESLRKIDLDTPVEDEDGIVRDVPLLAGYVDKEGNLHDTFSYREMNGRDEEALVKADVRANGAKLVDTLCERCVVAIGTLRKEDHKTEWGKIIRDMLGGDLDYMAFKIRELSKGKEVEFTHTCPNCGQKLHSIVNTDEFHVEPFKGLREVTFELARGYKDKAGVHKTGILRLPTGLDRELMTPLYRKNPSTAITTLLTRCITFDDTTYVSQSGISDLTLRDRDILEKLLQENAFGVDTKVEGLVCDNCGTMIDSDLGQTSFF